MRVKMERLLNGLRQSEQLTIFYSTHIITEVHKIANRIIILKSGKMVLDKAVAELPEGVEQSFLKHYGLEEDVPWSH